MQKFKFLLLILLTAFALVVVSGCSNDSKDSNPVNPGNGSNNTGNQASVTINGDGFNNVTLNINEGAAYYSTEGNATYTSIVAKTGSDTLLILLAVSGKQAGTFNWNDNEAVSYLINTKSDGYIAYVSINSGSTTITEFGGISGYVKGSFSGSVYESETNDPVDINGTFSIKRIADQ